jgi:hypothetical protein
MKILSTDIFTGEQVELTGTLTIDHPLSSYNQPVMLIAEWGNEPMSLVNWALAGCEILEATEQELKDFESWSSLLIP